jgi:hypothetical protein
MIKKSSICNIGAKPWLDGFVKLRNMQKYQSSAGAGKVKQLFSLRHWPQSNQVRYYDNDGCFYLSPVLIMK